MMTGGPMMEKLKRLELHRVDEMPAILELGRLYVSDAFGTAAHLCACGCGSKVRTPLGPTEWAVRETEGGVSLWPSVGNWQRPCRSHYVIDQGEVVWCASWSDAAVSAGRKAETKRRVSHFESLNRSRRPWLVRWLFRLLGR
jgi:hypothetical protein